MIENSVLFIWCDSCLLSILWKMIKASGEKMYWSQSQNYISSQNFELFLENYNLIFSKILINQTFFSDLWTKKREHFLTSGPNPLPYYLLLRYCAFVVNVKQGGTDQSAISRFLISQIRFFSCLVKSCGWCWTYSATLDVMVSSCHRYSSPLTPGNLPFHQTWKCQRHPKLCRLCAGY